MHYNPLSCVPLLQATIPLILLAFGSISGGVGATSVYPMNLVRTRLQASGSTGHPQRYTGIWDVTLKTYQGEGWRGFYRGLVPTLAKVNTMKCIGQAQITHRYFRLFLLSQYHT